MDSATASSTTSSIFNHPDADIVMRSSDLVDFHTFKLVLSLSSPVFKDMLSVPHPQPVTEESQDWKDGLPVVKLAEWSSVLEALLRLCDPGVEAPTFRAYGALDRTVLSKTLAAAAKYEMKKVFQLVEPHLLQYAGERYRWVFAVAYKHRLREVAVRAARCSLEEKGSDSHVLAWDWTDIPSEFDDLPHSVALRFDAYRERCASRLAAFDFDAHLHSWRIQCTECGSRSRSGRTRIAPFFVKFKKQAALWVDCERHGPSLTMLDRDVPVLSPGFNPEACGVY